MNTPAVVLGAGGQVGLHVIARLLELGCQVIAVRREPPVENYTGIDGLECVGWRDIPDRLEHGRDQARQAYSLLSCGPVGLALELLAGDSNSSMSWERVVVTGTTSTLTKASSPDATERRTISEITQACDAIRDHCAERDIPLAILSPSLIYGCGMDQNLSRVYRWIERFGFAPIAQEASGLRQPLHVADLAQTLVSATTAHPDAVIDSPVCGAGTVSYDEMIAGLFGAARKKKRLIRLPDSLVPIVITFSRLLSLTGELNREMFRRQSQDLIFDDSQAREQLDHNPRPYEPSPVDFRLPEPIQKIRQALL